MPDQIITVAREGEKTTRLYCDAAKCLEKINSNRPVPDFSGFAKEVKRKCVMEHGLIKGIGGDPR